MQEADNGADTLLHAYTVDWPGGVYVAIKIPLLSNQYWFAGRRFLTPEYSFPPTGVVKERSSVLRELRVIIAGSRDFNDYEMLCEYASTMIDTKRKDADIDCVRIVSGAARGADRLGERFATENGYHLSKFPADWDHLGKRAGYVRNGEMAKFAVEDDSYGLLLAFWDGQSRGTKHMIDTANKYGMEVRVFQF